MSTDAFNPLLIKNEMDQTYRFVNSYGETYGPFVSATEYDNGYAKVVLIGEDQEKFVDLLGRVAERKTPIGTMFYKFMKGLITFEGIPDQFFGNQTFSDFVEKELMARLEQKVYNSEKQGKRISKETIAKRQQTIKEMVQNKKAKYIKT